MHPINATYRWLQQSKTDADFYTLHEAIIVLTISRLIVLLEKPKSKTKNKNKTHRNMTKKLICKLKLNSEQILSP
jgi:hypothetical protein